MEEVNGCSCAHTKPKQNIAYLVNYKQKFNTAELSQQREVSDAPLTKPATSLLSRLDSSIAMPMPNSSANTTSAEQAATSRCCLVIRPYTRGECTPYSYTAQNLDSLALRLGKKQKAKKSMVVPGIELWTTRWLGRRTTVWSFGFEFAKVDTY